jgi:putative transposase
MTAGLVRYHHTGGFHFVTFSCHGRLPYLGSVAARDLFERSLEAMRVRYEFVVSGYVIMPQHVHLLLSEPKQELLAKALQAVKLSVARRRPEVPFWLARYHDFNVYTPEKREEKLHYMHCNPVRRGLAERPEEWRWSSFNHYATGFRGVVEIESEWTASRRDRAAVGTHVSEARRGAPGVVAES